MGRIFTLPMEIFTDEDEDKSPWLHENHSGYSAMEARRGAACPCLLIVLVERKYLPRRDL